MFHSKTAAGALATLISRRCFCWANVRAKLQVDDPGLNTDLSAVESVRKFDSLFPASQIFLNWVLFLWLSTIYRCGLQEAYSGFFANNQLIGIYWSWWPANFSALWNENIRLWDEISNIFFPWLVPTALCNRMTTSFSLRRLKTGL